MIVARLKGSKHTFQIDDRYSSGIRYVGAEGKAQVLVEKAPPATPPSGACLYY